MMEKKLIKIFDTTLRDGEQSPGATLNIQEKIKIARQLKKLNVDVIEAGLPASSPNDFKAVKKIAKEINGPIIAGLARALKPDIDILWEAIKEAKKPRIHIVLGTSEEHLKYKFRRSREEALQMGIEAIKYAKKLCSEIEYSTEDASRSNKDYLFKVIREAIRAGATVINIPDTVGYAVPEEWGKLIARIKEITTTENVLLSVHCHNDLGMAVPNTLIAIKNGADQVECTINGIGERAGNAALEEVVVALKIRPDYFGVTTIINFKEILKTSKMVSSIMGIPVQPNKAIVGANAFAHSSGIHQDGILKDKRTYQIIEPEEIGAAGHKFVLTARSGKHALKHSLEKLGYKFKESETRKIHQHFLEVADKKKEILEADLVAIVEEETAIPREEIYQLDYIQTTGGNKIVPTATVKVKKKGKIIQESACGNGVVDATYRAIDRIANLRFKLVDYSLKSVTGGKDALGEVTVHIKCRDKAVIGRGTSTDIIEASAKAYLNAINRYLATK